MGPAYHAVDGAFPACGGLRYGRARRCVSVRPALCDFVEQTLRRGRGTGWGPWRWRCYPLRWGFLAADGEFGQPGRWVNRMRLRGSVVEAGTNVPMPGRRWSCGESLIGGPRRATTDEEGRFDFPSSRPAATRSSSATRDSSPRAAASRWSQPDRETLRIPLSAEQEQTETLVVVEERKRLDSDKVSTGRVLSAESQAKIATTRRYRDVVQQVLGVSGGANPVMAGGSFRHNRYLVDGLDITDPVSNTFSANPQLRRHRADGSAALGRRCPVQSAGRRHQPGDEAGI